MKNLQINTGIETLEIKRIMTLKDTMEFKKQTGKNLFNAFTEFGSLSELESLEFLYFLTEQARTKQEFLRNYENLTTRDIKFEAILGNETISKKISNILMILILQFLSGQEEESVKEIIENLDEENKATKKDKQELKKLMGILEI